MSMVSIFKEEYKKLNQDQKEAVDSIEGPVMVVAGPGTGKTQILALRIGRILLETDTKSDSILCLTFTNSAVSAMRERLRKYIGFEASKVKVSTFHSFGIEMLEKYYAVLGLDKAPRIMDEKGDAVALCDEILQNNDWQYLRPRSDTSRYFQDLKSLVSLLKRERITPKDFENEIKIEIEDIQKDPESVSSRGESKGKLKKDAEKKIEGLERTLEAVKFYSLYEIEKKERDLFDFDDILEALNKIVEESEEAKEYVKTNFLYVLIDEHQDSSGVQNKFLEQVWGEVEKPNIFVVGDDRQLIYGFGGASLQYFENFKNTFGKAKLITLSLNYRSTQKILDSSHDLLQSSLSKVKLKGNNKENHPIRLVEAYYARDEIISCALDIKKKMSSIGLNNMAILVPKNKQVRSTITILKDMGVPVARGEMVDFFESSEAISFLRVLKIIGSPSDGVDLAESFFDKNSMIPPLKAHEFLKNNKMREFSLLNAMPEKSNLFDNGNEINLWLKKLKSWVADSSLPLYSLIQKVGTEFLLDTVKSHEELITRIEVLRTLLHLVLMQNEKNPSLKLSDFLGFVERLQSYGESIPMAIFGADEGVKVRTIHGSKGLEFDFVWIAHMDEKSFSGRKVGGFSLPESLKARVETRDEEVLKRQLYVAMTRAKRFCTISYALKSYTGGDQELANIVSDIAGNFEKQSAEETEKIILASDERAYVETRKEEEKYTKVDDLVKLVARDYEDKKVSVSLLNNFFECPWKWYFRNLLQLPESKAESLEFGNIVHGSIDAVLKLNKKPSKEDLQNIVTYQVKKSGFGDERKQKELTKLALNIVSRWVETRLDEISKNRENEKSISVVDDRFPTLTIYGKLDLIETINQKSVRVTDFKTGGVRKKSDIEKIDEEGRMSSYLRQLAMYSYLIKQSEKWKVEVGESRLEFLEAKDHTEAFYNRVITQEEIDLLVKDIRDYEKLVKTGEWVERSCHYNSYGKNTECEYCKMAEIYR